MCESPVASLYYLWLLCSLVTDLNIRRKTSFRSVLDVFFQKNHTPNIRWPDTGSMYIEATNNKFFAV